MSELDILGYSLWATLMVALLTLLFGILFFWIRDIRRL
jgi:hypothetical protein